MRPLCLSGLLSDATSPGFLALTLHVLQCNRNDIQNELFFQIFGMKFQHGPRPALEVIIQTKGQKGAKRNKATIQLYRWRAASHDNFPEPQRSEGMSRWGDHTVNQDDVELRRSAKAIWLYSCPVSGRKLYQHHCDLRKRAVVPGGGFEPPTRRFSIVCSTPELPRHRC